jgi:hypothetical protein
MPVETSSKSGVIQTGSDCGVMLNLLLNSGAASSTGNADDSRAYMLFLMV